MTDEIERLRRICAAAYQLAGAVDAPERFLNVLDAAAAGEPVSDEAIERLLPVELDPASARWIACIERMPPEGEVVLIFDPRWPEVPYWVAVQYDSVDRDGNVIGAAWNEPGSYHSLNVEPTHWMPLPELPQSATPETPGEPSGLIITGKMLRDGGGTL